MHQKTFKLKTEYIELIKLLKATHIANTGGHAKLMVDEGEVSLNGSVEFRKRAKIRLGDIVEANKTCITIVN